LVGSVVLAVVGFAALDASCDAEGAAAPNRLSANWSGYAVTGGAATIYTSVTGTWREPTVTCSPETAGSSSAFWVGLGGASNDAQSLEQIGTSAECTTKAQPTYYAWFELVPSKAVRIEQLQVQPGDLITTSVNVLEDGTTIELQIKNRTRKTSYTTERSYSTPDLTSAEWIAEAPAKCDRAGCSNVPLSDFGSIDFSRIAAIGDGVGATLVGSPWKVTSIRLVSDLAFLPGVAKSVGATPSPVSADGRSFSVGWSGPSP
jgi:Peptidase A4 family